LLRSREFKERLPLISFSGVSWSWSAGSRSDDVDEEEEADGTGAGAAAGVEVEVDDGVSTGATVVTEDEEGEEYEEYYINAMCKKAKRSLMSLRSLIGRSWGLGPKQTLWIHNTFGRSISTFGAIVWSHNLTAEQIDKLRSVQRLSLLAASGSPRTAPSQGLEVAMGVLPLHLRALQHAGNTWARLQLVNPGAPDLAIKGHRSFWSKVFNKLEISIKDTDYTDANIMSSPTFSVPRPGETLTCFTDGSVNRGKAGYSFVATRGDRVVLQGGGTILSSTSFLSEVTAIKALFSAIEEDLENLLQKGFRNIKIYCDNESAIQSMKSNHTNSKTVHETSRLCVLLQKHFFISFQWVKAHSGNTGNEYADYLAKLYLSIGGPSNARPGLTLTEIRTKVLHWVHEHWDKEWEKSKTCRQTKISYKKPLLPPLPQKCYIKKLSRDRLRPIIMCITGHGPFYYHRGVMGVVQNNLCRYCGLQPEESSHLLLHCPNFSSIRTQHAHLLDEGNVWGFVCGMLDNTKLMEIFD